MRAKAVILTACLLGVVAGQPLPQSATKVRPSASRLQQPFELKVDQSREPELLAPGCLPMAGEAVGGCIGSLLGAVASVIVNGCAISDFFTTLHQPPHRLVVIGTVTAVCVSSGAAGGTYGVGELIDQGGEWGPTFWGALAGTAVGIPLGMHYVWGQDHVHPEFIFPVVLLPTIGAAVGYNLGRSGQDSYLLRRLGLPAVALRPSRRKSAPPSLDLRLLNARL